MSANRHPLGIALACALAGMAAAAEGCEIHPRSLRSGNDAAAPVQGYDVVNVYPHDREAFTQGLAFADGVLYESTGLVGRSSLRKVELESGRVLERRALPARFFGEGIAVYGDRIVMLTWRARTGLVYDRERFELIGRFTYPAEGPTEGWGLTHDGRRLVMSDGSATLYYLHPVSYAEVGRLRVTDGGRPVANLNELEYVAGQIYANVFGRDRIARIDPQSGRVVAWVALEGLLTDEERTSGVDVLNGIAYDAQGERLFVTGKLWPKLFEIRLRPPGTPRAPP